MSSYIRTALISFALLALSALAAAQECSTFIVVNARDPKLALNIETLKAGDFEARLNKHKTPVSIASASQQYTSRLLVLVETDGLANDADIASNVDTITRMAKQAPEGLPVAFGVYADHAVFTKGFISDSKERTAAISAVREEAGNLGKRVALYDALLEALKLFGPLQPGDTLLLVGTPYDDRSGRSSSHVESDLLASGTRFQVMLRDPLSYVGRNDFLTNTHDAEKKMFNDLTEKTGGAYSEFDPGFFSFSWHGYMLEVKVPQSADHGNMKWKLKLKDETQNRFFRRAYLYAPAYLPPCGEKP